MRWNMKNENLRWWDNWWFLYSKLGKREGEVKEVLDDLGIHIDWERLHNISMEWGKNEPHRTIWEIYRVEGKLENGISPSELPPGVYVVVRVDAKRNELLRTQVLPLGGGEPLVVNKKIPTDEINPWGWNTFYPPLVLVSHQLLGVIAVELPFPKNRKFWCRSGSSSRYWRVWYIPRRYWNDYVNVFQLGIKKEV